MLQENVLLHDSWKSFCRLSHAKIWDRLSILQQDKDKDKKKRQRKRPRGLMDKASDFESEDLGFESLRGRIFANIPIGRDARTVASEIASMRSEAHTSE